MMDLIDRGAAIDAIKDLCEECDADYCGECRIDYPVKDAKSVLETLPPAQLCTNLAEVGTDCISRAQAIDAFNTGLNELVVDGEENAKTVENYLNRVIEKIKCLPSVQPKIVRCKDCKYWKRSSCCEGYCGEIDMEGFDEDHYCGFAERREVTE